MSLLVALVSVSAIAVPAIMKAFETDQANLVLKFQNVDGSRLNLTAYNLGNQSGSFGEVFLRAYANDEPLGSFKLKTSAIYDGTSLFEGQRFVFLRAQSAAVISLQIEQRRENMDLCKGFLKALAKMPSVKKQGSESSKTAEPVDLTLRIGARAVLGQNRSDVVWFEDAYDGWKDIETIEFVAGSCRELHGAKAIFAPN